MLRVAEHERLRRPGPHNQLEPAEPGHGGEERDGAIGVLARCTSTTADRTPEMVGSMQGAVLPDAGTERGLGGVLLAR